MNQESFPPKDPMEFLASLPDGSEGLCIIRRAKRQINLRRIDEELCVLRRDATKAGVEPDPIKLQSLIDRRIEALSHQFDKQPEPARPKFEDKEMEVLSRRMERMSAVNKEFAFAVLDVVTDILELSHEVDAIDVQELVRTRLYKCNAAKRFEDVKPVGDIYSWARNNANTAES